MSLDDVIQVDWKKPERGTSADGQNGVNRTKTDGKSSGKGGGKSRGRGKGTRASSKGRGRGAAGQSYSNDRTGSFFGRTLWKGALTSRRKGSNDRGKGAGRGVGRGLGRTTPREPGMRVNRAGGIVKRNQGGVVVQQRRVKGVGRGIMGGRGGKGGRMSRSSSAKGLGMKGGRGGSSRSLALADGGKGKRGWKGSAKGTKGGRGKGPNRFGAKGGGYGTLYSDAAEDTKAPRSGKGGPNGKGRKSDKQGGQRYSSAGPNNRGNNGGGDPQHLTAEDRQMMKKITIVAQLDKVPKPPAAMQTMASRGMKRSSSTGGNTLSSRFGANFER